MQSNIRLHGLTAASYTPMDSKGDVKYSTIEKQAERLIQDGVRGAFVCGTTGEGLSLSSEERRQVAQRWVEVAGRDLTVIVHVGHNSLPESRDLAQHAASIGAAGISALIPGFFKPANIHDLVMYCREMASAAPGLPFYYYHIPSLTGVTGSMLKFAQIGLELIPTLHGIKYTHSDLDEFKKLLADMGNELDVPYGNDATLLEAMHAGAQGAVGSSYNYAAPLYIKLIEAFKQSDTTTAREQSEIAKELTRILESYGVFATGKAAMKMIGLDCGNPRLPLAPLTTELYQKAKSEFTSAGIFAPVASSIAGSQT